MAHIVVLGAGLGGSIMAYELRDKLSSSDRITVVSKDAKYHFVPSNPWIAVGWREREDISIDLSKPMKKRDIDFKPVAAKKLHAEDNRLELVDGTSIDYDYLVIATGPELAFDEIEGLGPHGGFTQSICHVDHAEKAKEAFEEFCKNPGPIVVGAVQGASCFGPAYEFTFILDTELRRRK
ncbi:MAG: NAD(P)/FAD-dependent oxidoreductase, partial [Nitratireductor sp.]|nr:NAD(P)/FAD-dependent oxidoreductase [Nitratireductor sp.]